MSLNRIYFFSLYLTKIVATGCRYHWSVSTNYVIGGVQYTGLKLTVLNKISPLRFHLGLYSLKTLPWRHNDRDGVSNHQPHHCLLNRFFRRRSKKTSKLHVTGLCMGNSPVTGEFTHEGPVTRIFFPFDDVIMKTPSYWHRDSHYKPKTVLGL